MATIFRDYSDKKSRLGKKKFTRQEIESAIIAVFSVVAFVVAWIIRNHLY